MNMEMDMINHSLLGAIWALHEGALPPGACIAAAEKTRSNAGAFG